jgi:hypothetical protein
MKTTKIFLVLFCLFMSLRIFADTDVALHATGTFTQNTNQTTPIPALVFDGATMYQDPFRFLGYMNSPSLFIDLGKLFDISSVEFYWEENFKGRSYQISTSPDNKNWTQVLIVTNNVNTDDKRAAVSKFVRYVKIEYIGGYYTANPAYMVGLLELIIYGDEVKLSNVALNSTGTLIQNVSSKTTLPSAVFDGNTTVRACYFPGYVNEPSLIIDLGANYNISQIVLFWGKPNCYPQSYVVSTASNLNNWKPAFTISGNTNSTDARSLIVKNVRYIKIGDMQNSSLINPTYNVDLFDIQVFGDDVTKIVNPSATLTVKGSKFKMKLNNPADIIGWQNLINCTWIDNSANEVDFQIVDSTMQASAEVYKVDDGGTKGTGYNPKPPPVIAKAVVCLTDLAATPPGKTGTTKSTSSIVLTPEIPLIYSTIGLSEWRVIRPADRFFINGSNFRLLYINFDSIQYNPTDIVITQNLSNCQVVTQGFTDDPVYGHCYYIDFVTTAWGTASFQMRPSSVADFSEASLFVGPDFGLSNPLIKSKTVPLSKASVGNEIDAVFQSNFGISVQEFLVSSDPGSTNSYCSPTYYAFTPAGSIKNTLYLNPACTFSWVVVGVRLKKDNIEKIFQHLYTGSDLKGGLSESDEGTGEIQFFPNPSDDRLLIQLPDFYNTVIKFMDVSGRLLLNETFANNYFEINTTSYCNGIYIVQVEYNGNTTVRKVVIQH